MTADAQNIESLKAGATSLAPSNTHAPSRGVATLRPARSHLGGVDWMRLAGIFGVAYYHAFVLWYPDSIFGWYAFAGLHALTAAATYFAAASRSAASDREILVRRFHRLLVPWFVFSVPFMLKAIHSGKFRVSMLWTGGSSHLWFLPFIFVVGCAIAMASRRGWIVRSTTSAIGWTFAALVWMVIEPFVGPTLPAVEPVWQVSNAMPSALLGVAMFALPANLGSAIIQLIAIAAAGAIAWITKSNATLAWPAAAACGSILFGIARLLPVPATRASTFVGRTSFGVYLLHMLILTIIVRGLAKIVHAPGEAVASDRIGLIIVAQITLAVVLCIAIVAVLERTPLRRFVV